MWYPIQHFSYSSLSTFHRDPGMWKEKYILWNNHFTSSPAMIVGKMAHGVAEAYHKGTALEVAINDQITLFNVFPDSDIKFWKTGSREKILKSFTEAVKMYFEEMPNYQKVVAIEKTLLFTISDTINGKLLTAPLPLKGIPDLVYEENGEIIIEDYKFTWTHTKDEDGPSPSYWGQAIGFYYLVKQDLGRAPKEFRYREIKTSKNSDKSSQHNVITINFQSDDFELQKAFYWYQIMGFFKFIQDADENSYFPYNIYDMLNGRESMAALMRTTFWYEQNKADKSDLIRVDKGEIKETRFLETKAPDSIEERIKFKFQEFAIALEFNNRQEGFAFDRYLFVPSRGVKMSDVRKYADDVSQATEIENIRILAPVPGTKFVGVEIPRENRKFKKYTKAVGTPVGVDMDGSVVPFDITDPNTPHALIAGRTWSGKSEFLKVLIESFGKTHSLVLIDPKYVELSDYKKRAMAYGNTAYESMDILTKMSMEMTKRYQDMEKAWVNNIELLTGKVKEKRIVCVIEEYANLRQDKTYGNDIEALIISISALGRAAWIHLIIATQRPDVKIISGVIKANIGARICFATASQIDSKIILDQVGAEKLGGKGDMLYLYPGKDPVRLQSYHL